MNTKTILTLAVIAALPCVARGSYQYVNTLRPEQVADDGIAPAKRAGFNGPYVTAEPTVADETHIATTAYVKGAYNDAIAAVNMLDMRTTDLERGKQDTLYVWDPEEDDNVDIDLRVYSSLDDADDGFGFLVDGLGIKNALDAQRVTIYTTWDDDSSNATTQVALSTAQ